MALKGFIDYITESTPEGEVIEVASAATRIKMKMAFKKNKGKIMRAKERASKKIASPDQIKKRAMNKAKAMFTKKILRSNLIMNSVPVNQNHCMQFQNSQQKTT